MKKQLEKHRGHYTDLVNLKKNALAYITEDDNFIKEINIALLCIAFSTWKPVFNIQLLTHSERLFQEHMKNLKPLIDKSLLYPSNSNLSNAYSSRQENSSTGSDPAQKCG